MVNEFGNIVLIKFYLYIFVFICFSVLFKKGYDCFFGLRSVIDNLIYEIYNFFVLGENNYLYLCFYYEFENNFILF